MTLDWFWSIVGAVALFLIIGGVIFNNCFDGNHIASAWRRKAACNHKWEKRDDLSNHRVTVVVCPYCGKLKKVKMQ